MRYGCAFGLGLAVFGVVGCEGRGAPLEKAAFSDRLLLASRADPSASKVAQGEPCRPGEERCAEGACLLVHVHPGLEQEAYCSKTCTSDSDCLDQWSCSSVLPGPNGRMCVPPAEWKLRVGKAEVRQ
jgi:hypothetical protein